MHLISEYIVPGFHGYRQDKLQSIFRKSFTVIAGAGLFLTTSAYLAASVLADIFVGYDETLATLTVRGFRFFSFSFLLNGFCMYGSAFFTALNNGFISSVISLLQSVVFQIIAVIVLPLWLGTDGIWLSVSKVRGFEKWKMLFISQHVGFM